MIEPRARLITSDGSMNGAVESRHSTALSRASNASLAPTSDPFCPRAPDVLMLLDLHATEMRLFDEPCCKILGIDVTPRGREQKLEALIQALTANHLARPLEV